MTHPSISSTNQKYFTATHVNQLHSNIYKDKTQEEVINEINGKIQEDFEEYRYRFVYIGKIRMGSKEREREGPIIKLATS